MTVVEGNQHEDSDESGEEGSWKYGKENFEVNVHQFFQPSQQAGRETM
jgi:hypothetical protein